MMRNTRLVFALALLVPDAAGALPATCRPALDYTSATMTCTSMSGCDYCEAGESCDAEVDDGTCVVEENESLFCCNGCRCPTVQGASGTCLEVGYAGFCLYGALYDYCAEAAALTYEQFEACHTHPSGARVRSWEEGDCDADGTKNGADGEPCSERPGGGGDSGPAPGDGQTAEGDAAAAAGDALESFDEAANAAAPPPRRPMRRASCAATPAGTLFAVLLLLARRRARLSGNSGAFSPKTGG